MPTLNELVIQMTDDLQRDTANADVWVNGDEVTTYTDTNARIIPSIQKLVADFENRTEYTGEYVGGGTAYIRGQSFNEASAAFVVTADFTSTTFGGDAANYKTAFDLTAIVQAAIDAADAAAASETNAATSETNAATSETNAATSETNAATSETNAATSETNAGISETAAAASAVAAGDSETAAGLSEGAAQTAEANAEAALDEFTDIYLGAKPSDPTLDNDGDALADGAMYWNTATTTLMLYDLATTAWTGIITNATHTGDVTGDTSLTISTGAVDVPMLSATGTADATTYLRGDNTWAEAGGGAAWGDITGTLSSQTDLQSALDAKEVRTDVNGAFSAGDLGGDARGANAINIQASRSAVTQVASGNNSTAIGNQSTASAYYGTAVGHSSTASGGYSTASGSYSTASAFGSTASGYRVTASGYGSNAAGNNSTASGSGSNAAGYGATASGYGSNAAGYFSNASGNYSTASGYRVKTTVNNTAEIGYWSGSSVRAGAIRVHGTGMVAQTIQNRATAYGDGGATKGSEADNTVIREGIALRRNGNEILVDLNIAGTITTLSLGTAS